MPDDGRPGLSQGQLAVVAVLQFAENLSDRAAAAAVCIRIDWKYALGLELEDPGFDHSVLCEFRARLAEQDGAADPLLQAMLDRLRETGLLRAGGRQAHLRHPCAGRGADPQPPGAGRRDAARSSG